MAVLDDPGSFIMTVKTVLETGGGYAIAAIMFYLFKCEKEKNDEIRNEFTKLAVAQVEVNVKNEITLTTTKETMQRSLSASEATRGCIESVREDIHKVREDVTKIHERLTLIERG